MNLLLLLSALLSALTGVGGTARQPQVAQAVEQQVKAAAIACATRYLATRPAAPRATPLVSRTAPTARAFALAAVEPIFAGRRRV